MTYNVLSGTLSLYTTTLLNNSYITTCLVAEVFKLSEDFADTLESCTCQSYINHERFPRGDVSNGTFSERTCLGVLWGDMSWDMERIAYPLFPRT